MTETPIVRANVDVATEMAEQIAQSHLDDSSIMFRWASVSLDALSHLKVDDVDFTPLLQADVFDGTPTAKKLSLVELFKIAFLGDRITIFDPASLRLTLGQPLGRLLATANTYSRRLRRYLYKMRTGFKGV